MKKQKPKGLGFHGKKYFNSLEKVQKDKLYKVTEAFDLLAQVAYAKFDETIDVCFNLGVDPKHSDQMVRGAVVLPHGTGKSLRVAVIAKGDKAREAEAAGADMVGSDDLIAKIAGGFMDFDQVVATPDMMAGLSKVAKVLGPRGMMPNPKLGTVTMDVTKAVGDLKKGKVEYRTEKTGLIHVKIGKKSFGSQKLKDNFNVILAAIIKAKPAVSKGTYLKKLTLSATMSPGIGIDPLDATNSSST